MQSFWQWFIGEAGAGWIIGLIGLIGGVYAWLRRERPPKIVVQETRRISLLDVHPSQAEKIRVSYLDSVGNESRIASLQQTELAIYNTGTRDISEAINLVLTLRRADQSTGSGDKEGVGFWRVVFDDVTCTAEGLTANGSAGEQSVEMRIPYLNSYLTHRHAIMAYLITEYSVQLHLLRGRGRGWSARLSTLDSYLKLRSKLAQVIRVSAVALLALSAVPPFVALLDSPVYGALYNPTLSNLDRLIAMLVKLRESVQLHGVPPVWTRLFFEFKGGYGFRYGLALVLSLTGGLVSVYLTAHQRRIAGWLAARLLCIAPPERWRIDT